MSDIINSSPGYEFIDGKNMYRGTDLGRGGYVYAEPGMYTNVALLDVASMHPNSIINMNCFGEYTKRYEDIVNIRLHIKHNELDEVATMFDGKLAKYLNDKESVKALSGALKIPINSVYGLTSASFDNPFRDIRNKNNIVALRGALFMRTLQDEVQERGFTVAHIKTDSIKIPDATPEIIDFVMDFGKKYGYTFEHEATYEKMCLVNDAVYIAKYKDGDWTATGAQFQIPYVFKKLFSREDILFEDLCETKSVTSSMYLDMNENLPDVTDLEKQLEKELKKDDRDNRLIDDLKEQIEKGHAYIFVGKVGNFCPVKPGYGGGLLYREKDGKYYAVGGTKGYRWMESELIKNKDNWRDMIDESHFIELADTAVETIMKYGDYDWFVS